VSLLSSILYPSELKRDKSVLILGLGITGRAACAFFERHEIPVIKFDDLQTGCISSSKDIPWSEVSFVVQSPGINSTHEVVIDAKNRGIVIVSDVDIFVQSAANAFFIGITGTNGKSTTTALIGHVLKQHFQNVFIGGNIGEPALNLPIILESNVNVASKMQPLTPIYVLELSSFQLELSKTLALDIAVLTNMTGDHIDRHGSIENYVQSKKKIFDKAKLSILCIDDVQSQKIFDELKERQKTYSVSMTHDADFILNDDRVLTMKDGSRIDISHPRLVGSHNAQNIALAYSVCNHLGIQPSSFQQDILSFTGLPHRIEVIQEHNGIVFVNDSKATNADSTIRALCSFKNLPIFLIAGGKPKIDGILPAVPYMQNVKEVFLIGSASDRFARELGQVKHTFCHDLGNAISKAIDAATALSCTLQKVILLSPACASYDQFKNYEERGDVFRLIVNQVLKHE
jgi:UDP-N-acetylmuramoylalanine--D-glutamate ligase